MTLRGSAPDNAGNAFCFAAAARPADKRKRPKGNKRDAARVAEKNRFARCQHSGAFEKAKTPASRQREQGSQMLSCISPRLCRVLPWTFTVSAGAKWPATPCSSGGVIAIRDLPFRCYIKKYDSFSSSGQYAEASCDAALFPIMAPNDNALPLAAYRQGR
jgi:hypothetical protein